MGNGFPRAEISLMKSTESFCSASGALTCVVTVVGMGGGGAQERLAQKPEAGEGREG